MNTTTTHKNNNFTNLNYDKCALDKKNQENYYHFSWMTDTNSTESPNKCYQGISPFLQTQNIAPTKDLIDTESELFGQNRILTKSCPDKSFPILKTDCDKYNKGEPCECKSCVHIKYQVYLNDCDKFLVPEYTRVNLPCDVLSGININRFDYICEDVQSLLTIQDNSYIGLNTRLAVRDRFSQNKY